MSSRQTRSMSPTEQADAEMNDMDNNEGMSDVDEESNHDDSDDDGENDVSNPFSSEDEDDYEDVEVDGLTDDSSPQTDSEKDDFGKRRRGEGKATDNDNLREITETYQLLPSELRTIARENPRKLKKTADNSKAWLAKHRPMIKSVQDILDRISTAREDMGEGGVWTQELEDELQQRLADDPYLDYLATSKLPKSNERFIPMWKKICRVRQQCPSEIISPLKYLEYGATPRVQLRDGTTKPDPVWSSSFCERLSRLVLSGPWKGNMDLLATFLRYSSACRVDDRRSVPLFMAYDNDDSLFVREVKKKLASHRDPRKTIPRAHQDARREVRQRGVELPWYSQMMRNIEKLAFKPVTNPPGEDADEFPIYPATTEDLRTLERAVSNCTDLGRPMFHSVRDAARLVSHGRNYDHPKTYKEVQTLQKAIYMSETRELMKRSIEGAVESPEREMSSLGVGGGSSGDSGLNEDDMGFLQPDTPDVASDVASEPPQHQEPQRKNPRDRNLPPCPYLGDPNLTKEDVDPSASTHGAWGWGDLKPLDTNFKDGHQPTNVPSMDMYHQDSPGASLVFDHNRDREVWDRLGAWINTSLMYKSFDGNSESD
ncbi:hypothetical protein F4774DRAFT_389830 [Daldinia eschscholtzii]|nr:hypothetical protein F4774DRAFT_389830 [Daldinia eschscholtzii]